MRVLCSVLALAASVALVSNLSAADQPRRGPGGPGAGGRGQGQFNMIDMIVRGLELSDAQKAKLEELKKEQGPKLREAYEKMSSFLTDEQKKAREEAMKAARDAGKSREESREAIEKALKLTDEQKKKQEESRKSMEEMNKNLREKIMAILTPEQQETVKKRMAEGRGRKPGAGR